MSRSHLFLLLDTTEIGGTFCSMTEIIGARRSPQPMTYLMEWRLNCAARLLRETDAPLAVIARQVGYSTEYAFAGAFRREYGVPPGRFRDATRAN